MLSNYSKPPTLPDLCAAFTYLLLRVFRLVFPVSWGHLEGYPQLGQCHAQAAELQFAESEQRGEVISPKFYVCSVDCQVCWGNCGLRSKATCQLLAELPLCWGQMRLANMSKSILQTLDPELTVWGTGYFLICKLVMTHLVD